MKIRGIFIILVMCFSMLAGGQTSRLSFEVKIANETTNLSRFSYFTLPGDTLPISVISNPDMEYELQCEAGRVIKLPDKNHWLYISPGHKGYYQVTVRNHNTQETMTLLVFVMVPASELKNGYLNGYRIGTYPEENYKNKTRYQKPKGFIEVTQTNKDIFISPHFQLKQFLCKGKGGWPKYVVISPRILIKLELLIDKLHENGIETNTLFLMSAYRTPYYNKAIGNVKYSRHQYGDAVDIYVDENMDGIIDDLNKDGFHTIKDAEVIQKLVDQIDEDPKYKRLIGGTGKYNKNSAHTYFIHIDTRGYKARW